MTTKIERNDDGTIKGMTTMGDVLKKEEPTPDEKELQRIKEHYEKKYGNTVK